MIATRNNSIRCMSMINLNKNVMRQSLSLNYIQSANHNLISNDFTTEEIERIEKVASTIPQGAVLFYEISGNCRYLFEKLNNRW